jgi:hypothetical protein
MLPKEPVPEKILTMARDKDVTAVIQLVILYFFIFYKNMPPTARLFLVTTLCLLWYHVGIDTAQNMISWFFAKRD